MSALPPLLQAFLGCTRVPSDPQPDAAVVRSLADFGKMINSQFVPGAGSPMGRVHVLSSFDCITETVWLPTEPWVLFDTGLKSATGDLNSLALAQSPPHDALRWAFRSLARFVAAEGDWQLACAALIASTGSSGGNVDPKSANVKLADACAVVQDYFTLAHEFVHLALAEGRLAEAAAAHDADVTSAFVSSEPTAETLAVVRSLITYEMTEVLGRPSGVDPADVALPTAFAGELGSALRNLDTHSKRERPAQLKEELLCDAIATDLAIGAFRDTFDEPLLLLAMYLGFRNLQCVEIVRALAETLAAANRGRGTDEDGAHTDTASSEHTTAVWNAGWRLSAWRNWLPASLLQTPSTEIWDMLRRASRSYDRSIGNEILLALPSRLSDWLTELRDLGPLPLTSDLVALMVLGDCDVKTLTMIIERSGFNEDHSATRLAGALHEQRQPHQHAVQMETVRRWLGVGESRRNDEPAARGVHRVQAEAAQKPFQRVMEVYNLREDKRGQMRPGNRVFRY